MMRYREKRLTLIDGELIHVEVDVIFWHGYAGCGPYARVTFPNGQEYSIDSQTLFAYFDQVPNQHIAVNLMNDPGPYDRTNFQPLPESK